MAGFGGFAQGLSDGLMNGARINAMADSAKDAELAREERAARMEDAKRGRELEQGRRDDFKLAAQPVQTDQMDINPPAPKQLQRHEVFEEAARRRFAAGDVEGYEQFLNRGAAERTRFYTDRLQDAYRKNDLAGGLALLNEFPDGVNYEVEQGENGALVGIARGDDGKERARQPFASQAEAWSFISQRANPGDIFGSLRQQARDEIETRKSEAEIKLKGAQTEQANAAANRSTAEAETERQYGGREAQARLGLIGAQTAAAGRSNDNTPSSLREFDGLQQRGFGRDEAAERVYPRSGGSGKSPDAEAVLAARKELVEAYTDPVKRSQLSESEIGLAKQFIAESRAMPASSGRGFAGRPLSGGTPSAPANRPPLSSFQK